MCVLTETKEPCGCSVKRGRRGAVLALILTCDGLSIEETNKLVCFLKRDQRLPCDRGSRLARIRVWMKNGAKNAVKRMTTTPENVPRI